MSNTTKRPYSDIFPIAQDLLTRLAPNCSRIELAGSLRRKRPLIGDVEIVAIAKRLPLPTLLPGINAGSFSLVDNWFMDNVPANAITRNGDKLKTFVWQGVKVDLFLVTPETWGCLFLIRTGSAEFSRAIVQRPVACFGNGRLYLSKIHRDLDRPLDTPEEEDVFKALGLKYIAPEERNEGRYRFERGNG